MDTPVDVIPVKEPSHAPESKNKTENEYEMKDNISSSNIQLNNNSSMNMLFSPREEETQADNMEAREEK